MERNGIQQALFYFFFTPPSLLSLHRPVFSQKFHSQDFSWRRCHGLRNATANTASRHLEQKVSPIKIIVGVESAKGLLRVGVTAVIAPPAT